MVNSSASSTHEASSLRESDEQDQRQENEPHVRTAAADAHGLCRHVFSHIVMKLSIRVLVWKAVCHVP